MTFAEKLDFLMNLTRTSNSTLAARVILDASYISRLRRGKRLMPKDNCIIQNMAAYFSRHCSEEYQRKVMSGVITFNSLSDADQLTEEITQWLVQDEVDRSERVGRFLSGLSDIGKRPASLSPAEESRLFFPEDAVSVYMGIKGKRLACEYFASEVAAREKPQTLLLFSDEETSWMTDDPQYARKWADLMTRILAKGNRIKIIHTISRDLNEMLNAVSQWMPLYMTGLIEPYYYPKKRDGIFKRTLFIAPETAAVVSNSIGDQIKVAPNVLYRDRAAIESFAEEFNRYLRLCRPLMQIFRASDNEAYIKTLMEFWRERADTLMMTESLSLLTMPEALLLSISKRAGLDAIKISENREKRNEKFLENMRSNRFMEIISLPEIEKVKTGGVKVSLSELMNGGTVFYTPEEFSSHLEHIIEMLLSYDNYFIHLVKKLPEDRYIVNAREELGVIVAKTSQPPVVLVMREENMTAAFWDLLRNLAGEKVYTVPEKETVLCELRNYLQKLKSALHNN